MGKTPIDAPIIVFYPHFEFDRAEIGKVIIPATFSVDGKQNKEYRHCFGYQAVEYVGDNDKVLWKNQNMESEPVTLDNDISGVHVATSDKVLYLGREGIFHDFGFLEGTPVDDETKQLFKNEFNQLKQDAYSGVAYDVLFKNGDPIEKVRLETIAADDIRAVADKTGQTLYKSQFNRIFM